MKRYKDLITESVFNDWSPVKDASDGIDKHGIYRIERPEVLDRINAVVHSVIAGEHLDPTRIIRVDLRHKLNIMGFDIDLHGIQGDMSLQDSTEIEIPINRFGGRFGKTGTEADDEFTNDDGIEHSLGYSVSLFLSIDKLYNSTYTIMGYIGPSSSAVNNVLDGEDGDALGEMDESHASGKNTITEDDNTAYIVSRRGKQFVVGPVTKQGRRAVSPYTENAKVSTYILDSYFQDRLESNWYKVVKTLPGSKVSLSKKSGDLQATQSVKEEIAANNASSGDVAGLDDQPPMSKSAQKKKKEIARRSKPVGLDEALTLASDDLNAVKNTAQKLAKQSPDLTYYVVKNKNRHFKGKEIPYYSVYQSEDWPMAKRMGAKKVVGYGAKVDMKEYNETVTLDEVKATARNIVKGLSDSDGPFTVVAIKGNKVIKQESTKRRDALPAIITAMRTEVGSGVTIGIEDREGIIRNTFKESTELIERVGKPMKTVDGLGKIVKVEKRWGSPSIDSIVQVKLDSGETNWYYNDGKRFTKKTNEETGNLQERYESLSIDDKIVVDNLLKDLVPLVKKNLKRPLQAIRQSKNGPTIKKVKVKDVLSLTITPPGGTPRVVATGIKSTKVFNAIANAAIEAGS